MRQVNQRTINLIKEFEGFSAEAYRDAAGVWTIGYGTTAAAGVGVTPVPGMTITKAEAEWYLQKAVNKFAGQVEAMLTAPANDNQFGAFVSLAYNIGPGAFSRSSALRRFNEGKVALAAEAILAWNKATVNGRKVVLRGLARRREAEKALFLSPVVGGPAKPTSPSAGKKPGPGFGIGAVIAFLLAGAGVAITEWWDGIKAAMGW